MSEMSSHDPFEHMKHKLWPKEGPKVKLSNWLMTTKSWEWPWFPCVQVVCDIPLESSQWGLQLFFRPHLNRRPAHKIMALQSHGSPNFGNFEIPKWELRTKCHLDAGHVASRIVYYKGESGGFPQVWAVVSLVNLNLPMVRPSTKNVLAMH
jgi:hypothetical protein